MCPSSVSCICHLIAPDSNDNFLNNLINFHYQQSIQTFLQTPTFPPNSSLSFHCSGQRYSTPMIFQKSFNSCQIIKMISCEGEWPRVGEYVDFKDKDNNPWQVGYIVSKAKSIVKVRSQGWSCKFDELIQLTAATRVKPFRTIVRGYTGQVKNPALREHWKYTSQIQQQNAKSFAQFVQQLSSKSAHEITQFFRGQHYFWIDFLLTVTYTAPQELTLAYDYLKTHIDFTKKYLEEVVEVGIWRWCTQEVSESVRAYRDSYYELMDALNILMGSNVRQLDFQKNHDKIIKEVTGSLTHEKYFTKYITQNGLDEVYLNLVHKLEQETFVEGRVIPIPFLYEFFHIFSPVEKALLQKVGPPFDTPATNKDQRKKLATRVFNIIQKQVEQITPLQLRSHQNQKEVDSLLGEIKSTYFRLGLEQLAFEWIEKVRLQVAVLLIQTDSLERKLKGITKLKETYQAQTTVNEFHTNKLRPQEFTKFLKEHRVVQSLYENNDHPEILKKGSEICQLLLKSNFIQISTVTAIWSICAHKHQAVRKVIYQLWFDVIPSVNRADLEKFVEPVLSSCLGAKQGQPALYVQDWEVEMLFAFSYTLIKQFDEITTERQDLDVIATKFIDVMYAKLLEVQESIQVKQLIPCLTRLMNTTLICNKVVKEAYQSIAKNAHLKLNMNLLISFYEQSFEKETFLPSNALEVIFFTFQSPKNHSLSSTIFQLMDEIIKFSSNIAGNYILTPENFDRLWTISQQNQQVKTQFYSWLIKKNSDGLFGVPTYQINTSIPRQLKSTIFTKFLCDHTKLDYFNISLQELSIFKEFLIFENKNEDRIQLKRLMTLIKIVRLKSIDILGNKFLWDIFLNCKKEEVIRELSKIILTFHFNYHDCVDFKTRKIRIVSLLVKLQKQIRDGFKKGNIRLMRHSLILLKDIIDFVKEKKEPREIMSNYQQYFKTTIKVMFENKKYELQVFFGVTYYEIKGKIAELIKLDRTKFQMFSLKNEEISLQFGEVPFCFMQEKTIKVMRVHQSDDSMSGLVLNFIKDRVENTLIDMLEDESICEEVFQVLEDIEIKVEEGEDLLLKLTNIIEKHQQLNKESSSKYEIYIYLFYLRILHFMIEKPNFLNKFIRNKQLNKLVARLDITLNNPLTIVYVFNLIDILYNILKKLKNKDNSSEDTEEIVNELKDSLKEKAVGMIHQVSHQISSNPIEEKDKNNMKKVRIVFNCLNIIQELEKTQNAVNYIANHLQFSDIVRQIFLQNSLNDVRLIFVEKLKKFMQKYREAVHTSNDEGKKAVYLHTVDTIAQLFIGQLYTKIRDLDGIYANQKKVQYFYKFIGFIITLLSQEQFQVYVIGKEENSFYQNLLQHFQQLSDPQDVTQSPNYLLSSHLFVLTTIYGRSPSLLDDKIMHYLLYQCLFNKEGESQRSEVSCKRVETIKAALEAVKTGCSDYKNAGKLMKVVRDVQEFHKLDYWRTSDNWSTSIESEVKAKYVGLENPGCICYLNSLTQQLYMTKNFREQILALNLASEEGDTRLEMLKALKELFFNLQYSQQIALNPTFFTKTIKSHDNKPMIKIFVQMDIDEFCSILFDKIEHQLTNVPNQSNIVKNNFGGIYAHQIISKECKHCSEREEQFISIGLEVKRNIQQSFNALIKGEMLDGENKYYCEKCDKKVKAEKVLTIKKLPRNLILSLKRFEYNYEIDAKIKINDYCEFPTQLNLKKYSQQEINKANTSTLDSSEEILEKEEELPDSYFSYKLKGVVVHTGSADSGHYYSFIEDSQKNWFEFNDSHVTPFDPKNLPEQAFGSKDSYEQKVKNAYLLFYERVQSEPSKLENLLPESAQNTAIVQDILNKNKTISKFRLLFSKDYSDFVNNLLEKIDKFDLTLEEQEQWHRFILTYYLFVRIREGGIEELIPISQKIFKLLQTNRRFSSLFLSSVTNLNFLEEVFVYGSNRDKVKVLSNLLVQSFLSFYKQLPDNYDALKETLVFKLLSHIKYLTVLHGNIYELEIFLEEILRHTRANKDNRLFKFLVQQFSIEKYVIVNLFGLPMGKEEKQLAVQYKQECKGERNELASPVKNEGKKYLPSLTRYSWQLIHYFIQYLEPTDIVEEPEEQTNFLSGINFLLEKIIKNGNLTKIIHECGIEKSVYWLYKVFKETNKVFYLIDAIEKGLKDFQSTKYRPLLLLLNMILVDGETPQKLVKMAVQMLARVQAVNEKYFLQVNFIHQWMLKYVEKSPLFMKCFSENAEMINDIDTWISIKPLPSSQLIKKHKNPANERLQNRLNGILVSSEPNDYLVKSNFLKRKFQAIKDLKFQQVNHHIQWQKEFLDQFQVNADAFYFDISLRKWQKVKILHNNFGLLNLQHTEKGKNTEANLWQDNERISSFRYFDKQQKESFDSEQQPETGLDVIEDQDLYN